MSVEIPSNKININEREQKLKQGVDRFKTLMAEKFKNDDLIRVNRALELMLQVHLPQKDRSDGKPYAQHPLEVAEKVMEISDNLTPDLIVSALLHDSIEDMPEIIFAKRANRKYPDHNYQLKITEDLKKKYFQILRDWSFKEIEHDYGPKVLYYLYNLTNHDFDSLVEELPELSAEEKIEFKNQAYASHVEDIINDSDLCLLKYADFSSNVDLKSLPNKSEKYFKLKRKYSSIIPIFINRLKKIDKSHQLYTRKDSIIKDLETIYQKQYNSGRQ